MLKSISFRKVFLCSARFGWLILFISCFLFSCSNQTDTASTDKDSTTITNASIPRDTSKGIGQGAMAHDSRLYALYLNNTATNPELDRLVKKGNPDRARFQIYDSLGFLRLAAYKFRSNDRVEPGFMLHLDTAYLSHEAFNNRVVHLGNLQFGRLLFKTLRDSVNAPGFEYILFIPEVVFDAEKGYQHLVYRIEASSTLPLRGLQPSAITNKVIGYTNPSPPRNTDEEY